MSLHRIELRPSEIILIRRALAVYARHQQDLITKSKPEWEKEELRKRIGASDRISERLIHDVRPADTVSQAVLDRVVTELKAYGEDHFADSTSGWEAAAEALVKSLTRGTNRELSFTKGATNADSPQVS
jgi:hypothetical protein